MLVQGARPGACRESMLGPRFPRARMHAGPFNPAASLLLLLARSGGAFVRSGAPPFSASPGGENGTDSVPVLGLGVLGKSVLLGGSQDGKKGGRRRKSGVNSVKPGGKSARPHSLARAATLARECERAPWSVAVLNIGRQPLSRRTLEASVLAT